MRVWGPILAALVIFGAGLLIGAWTWGSGAIVPADAAVVSGGERGERRGGPPGRGPWSPVLSEEQIGGICRRMTADLTLSTGQSNEVFVIMSEGQKRMKVLADDFAPRAFEEFRRTREEIKQVLTPEQLEEFEESFRKRQNRWHRKEGASDEGRERFRGPPPSSEKRPPDEAEQPMPSSLPDR